MPPLLPEKHSISHMKVTGLRDPGKPRKSYQGSGAVGVAKRVPCQREERQENGIAIAWLVPPVLASIVMLHSRCGLTVEDRTNQSS
jgi:hypothetical protein